MRSSASFETSSRSPPRASIDWAGSASRRRGASVRPPPSPPSSPSPSARSTFLRFSAFPPAFATASPLSRRSSSSRRFLPPAPASEAPAFDRDSLGGARPFRRRRHHRPWRLRPWRLRPSASPEAPPSWTASRLDPNPRALTDSDRADSRQLSSHQPPLVRETAPARPGARISREEDQSDNASLVARHPALSTALAHGARLQTHTHALDRRRPRGAPRARPRP